MPLEAGYSAERLARVRDRAIREAAARPAKGEMRGGDGVVEYRFPVEACMNAIQSGEELHPDYLRDMAKRYPEGRVAYTPRRVAVGRAAGVVVGVGRRTEYGRVTYHKRYMG